MALYSAWIRQPPAKAQGDPSYNVTDDEVDRTKSGQRRPKKRKAPVVEDEENRTSSGRLLMGPRPKKRKAPVVKDEDNRTASGRLPVWPVQKKTESTSRQR